MQITQKHYGTVPKGRSASLFQPKNSQGLIAEITNHGGIIVALQTPDRHGQLLDITLGKAALEADQPHFGAITGRTTARIPPAKFTVDGYNYPLIANNGANCRLGGLNADDKVLWHAQIIHQDSLQKLRLKTIDPDGENDFSGTVQCTVSYAIIADHSLGINDQASSENTTRLNLTHHAYFNLSGAGSGDILKHQVQIQASTVASADAAATLLRRRDPVAEGFNDFPSPVTLGRVEELVADNADIHYFLDKGRTAQPELAAQIYAPSSGRTLETLTTESDIQFYAAISLPADGSVIGKSGMNYEPDQAFCLETPDLANSPELGGAILPTGE